MANDAAQPSVDWNTFVSTWWNLLLSGQLMIPGIGVSGVGGTPAFGIGIKGGWTSVILIVLGVILVLVSLGMFMAEETAKSTLAPLTKAITGKKE